MYNGIYDQEQYAYMHDTLAKWLALKIQGGSLGENIRAKGIGKVALYGANSLGGLACRDIRGAGLNVLCFIDRNADRYGREKEGLEVLGLDQLGRLPQDCYILVTPEYYFREIMEDLTGRGIGLERILSLSMIAGW